MNALHDSAVVIDGLIISNWSRAVFEDMRRGGLTAANCTCSVWEGIRGTMDNIARWKRWIDENEDLLVQVHTTADIHRAKRNGKVGIILGWQNTSGIEDQLDYLRVFRDLGVRVMQLTYNTQNFVGSGCYEGRDGGLSDFGRDVIDEMNRLGIVVDLSHVGPQTSEDAIRHSSKPVSYTHCCPAALKDHPRNKSDEQLRFIAEHRGFVGVAAFQPFLAAGPEATLDDYLAAVEHVFDLVGEERVGIGTDFTQDQPDDFFHWLRFDKGYGRELVDLGVPSQTPMTVEGLRTIGDYPNLTAVAERRGWSEQRIRRFLGENWLAFFEAVWGA